MTFVHPLLLGGLLLVGIPVLIHLIMQQKPKHVLFPAFRFLLQKHRINQRRLRLRHLLLLTLRILLIAAICLALARPVLQLANPLLLAVFRERLNLQSDRPLAVVLVFDTSYSMEYKVSDRTRLDNTKRLALELLAELPDSSRVALFDSGETGGEWQPSLAAARDKIAGLELRHANAPVTRHLNQAYRLLADLEKERDGTQEIPPRFLYVFSDRTQECWDHSEVRNLRQPAGVNAFFIDLGVDKPEDVAIADLKLSRQVVPAGRDLEILVKVKAIGRGCDTELSCRLDGQPLSNPRPVQLKADEEGWYKFVCSAAGKPDSTGRTTGLASGPHQIEVRLRTDDGLPYDNVRYATFEVRAGRPVLVLVDELKDALPWEVALEATGEFRCEVLTLAMAGELTPAKLLADYKAICLVNVANVTPEWWRKFKDYVAKGGGLAVVPPGEEHQKAYTDEAALQVLPATLSRVLAVAEGQPGVRWQIAGREHALLAPFHEWSKNQNVDFEEEARRPRATRYWEVTPHADDAKGLARPLEVVRYADDKKRPALVEGLVGSGHVLLFTTTLDGRRLDAQQTWNNYWQGSSFGLVLANLAVGYLAGDADKPVFNHLCGQTVTLPVPFVPFFALYSLQGPGLSGASTNVPRAKDQTQLQIAQAIVPGNFTLVDGDGNRTACFSLNDRPEECVLTPRVPVEQIEELFGTGAVWEPRPGVNLRDTLQGHAGQPVEVELFPWLMILLLLVLALENLLANKFYRRPAPEQGAG